MTNIRSEIPEKYKWDMSAIYPDMAAFDADFAKAAELIAAFPRHEAGMKASAEGLCAFCRGIQAGSPVDSHVTPEPWAMPGYNDPVIMAAGAFTQGSSIELSADGPVRPPYTAFFQGGLTYESGKLAIMLAADAVTGDGAQV